MFALSRFAFPCHVTCVAHGSVRDNWRRSLPRWHPLSTWSLTGRSPSWSRPRDSSRRSLLWSRFCLPRACGRSRSPFPRAAPYCPRGSILLSHRVPTGLSVKSCPAAPPDRSVSTDGRSGSPASAAGRGEPQSAASATSASAPSKPRAAAADPSASAAQPACPRRSSGAAEARRRRRYKHRRRVRRHSNRSMWREI